MNGGPASSGLASHHERERAEANSVFAIDVGGTWVRAARWSQERGIDQTVRYRTPSLTNFPAADPAALVEALAEQIAQLPPKGNRVSVGISLGAAVDHRSGRIYGSAPLWGAGTSDVPLLQLIKKKRPDVRWTIINDVTAMLLAYYHRHPEFRGQKLLLTTVSTGIASRTLDLTSGDVPLDGAGLQGEIGHVPATTEDDLHLMCACGEPDHVAAYASGPGIRNVASAVLTKRTSNLLPAMGLSSASPESNFEVALASALASGDSAAVNVLRIATQPLADAFTSALTLDPTIDRLVLTGGVIDSIGTAYRSALLRRMLARGMYYTAIHHSEWVADRVVLAATNEASAIVGAGLTASKASSEQS